MQAAEDTAAVDSTLHTPRAAAATSHCHYLVRIGKLKIRRAALYEYLWNHIALFVCAVSILRLK